jgi:hypothetical protein
MANNGWWCDSDRQFRVLSGMQGDNLATWCSLHNKQKFLILPLNFRKAMLH